MSNDASSFHSNFVFSFRLVTEHPSVGMLFPFGDKKLSYDQLREDQDVRAHGKRVMETVGQAVSNLDDLDTVATVLRDLAQRHIGYSVTRQHFAVISHTSSGPIFFCNINRT